MLPYFGQKEKIGVPSHGPLLPSHVVDSLQSYQMVPFSHSQNREKNLQKEDSQYFQICWEFAGALRRILSEMPWMARLPSSCGEMTWK